MAADIIVGSGPAGVAAAVALLSQNRRVVMLDVGEEMEPARDALRVKLSTTAPDEWQAEDLAEIRAPRQAEQTDSIKPFGSDFLFRDRAGFFGSASPPSWLTLRPSFAKGGLSNGWGASVLPYRQEDIEDWPINQQDLMPHYRAVQSFTAIASKPDDLAEFFPVQTVSEDTSLPLTQQASRLLNSLSLNRNKLNSKGVLFGQARQAVSPGCRLCAMCLHGCPYDLIFNAANVVEELQKNENFTYKRGLFVEHIEETTDEVSLRCRDILTHEKTDHRGDRVFIGAGVLPTTRLVLNSLNQFDRAVYMKDSLHFFLPVLHGWGPKPDPAIEPRHVLTQLFLELSHKDICPKTVHSQIYTYNDLYAVDMRKRFGVTAPLLSPLIEYLSRRLVVAQTFLHSDFSPQVAIKLSRKEKDGPVLNFERVNNDLTHQVIKQTTQTLGAVFRTIGAVPLTPLSHAGAAGSSFHCGGTFPMVKEPKGLESDALGRPAGLTRTHVIDASTFPSIPATTITLSVMANAHRIASEATRAMVS